MQSNQKIVLICGIVLQLILSATCIYADEAKCDKIAYIRSDIPAISVSKPLGNTYTELIPDTLDVMERAELAIHGLTCTNNPTADNELYFFTYFDRNPVVMEHSFADWCGLKFVEALPLLRMVTGNQQKSDIDQVWMNSFLKSLGPDGLYYIPLIGRPWLGKSICWATAVARTDGTTMKLADPLYPNSDRSVAALKDKGVSQIAHPFSCGRALNIMIINYLQDGNVFWKQAIEKMIDRLLELAVHKDDYCYFPALLYEPNAHYDKNSEAAAIPLGLMGSEINGRVMHGPAIYYKISQYGPALELAEKLSRFMRYHVEYFAEDGSFTGDKHFHSHTISLLSMLEYATAAKDKEFMDFIAKSYAWAKSPQAYASSLLGFFPEHAKSDYKSCETCEIADMIGLALKLSEAGHGDYYEDAERWTRNHFVESQLTRCDWIYQQAENLPKKPVAYNETADRVPERNLGSFAGWSGANDWWVRGPGIMHCCTGNAARSLYYIWEHILTYDDGTLWVNMLLNRASPWADVYSYIPYEGQVNIKIKKACKQLRVHAPEWIETGSDKITIQVNDKQRKVCWYRRYLDVGKVQPGDQVVVRFPIKERIVKETIGTIAYTLTVKGNTVVHIDPTGKKRPLYLRDHYRDNQVRWRESKRFICKQPIDY